MEINIGKKVISAEIKALDLLKKSISSDFSNAIEVLFKTKGKIIISGLGKSGHIATKISSTFSSIGSPSVFLHPTEANHGDLGMIKKSDSTILISNSGETSELTNIILHCKKSKIPIISITSEKSSTLAKNANIVLETPKPNFELAACWRVEVINGALGLTDVGFLVTSDISKLELFTSSSIIFASSSLRRGPSS